MLKKRIIKGIILIVISFAVYLLSSGCCEAATGLTTNFINTYYKDVFDEAHRYGGIELQYVKYMSYEENGTQNSFLCNKLGYPPILVNYLTGTKTLGSPDTSQVSTRDKEDTINPQIAYALSIGILPENLGGNETTWRYLQELVWDANPDTGSPTNATDGEDGILDPNSMWASDIYKYTPKEVQRFRKVYEEIFEKTLGNDQALFKIDNKGASLYVDQNEGTYIYGPFQLKVNCEDASEEAMQYLRAEILQEGSFGYIEYNNDIDFEDSEAYIESFYKFHKSIDDNFINNGISDGNKKKLRYDVNPANKDTNLYSTIIVDKSGNPIEFPTLTKNDEDSNNFFIKFYPANEGAIINLGNDNAELFELKVKYGSYIKYKEHIQKCMFYTKGLIGYLQTDNIPGGLVIPENSNASNYTGKDIIVSWQRIDGSDPDKIFWESYLEGLMSPQLLGLYDNSQGKFLSSVYRRNYAEGTSWTSIPRANIFLDNYYTDLKCTGFSLNGQVTEGSLINVPFQFAGDSDVEITNYTKAVKRNYGFPLTQKMELEYFYGIVEYTAYDTDFYISHRKRDKLEPEYDEETGERTNPEYSDWYYVSDVHRYKTIKKYKWERLTPDKLSQYTSCITSQPAPRRPTRGQTIDDDAYPSNWPSDNATNDYGSTVHRENNPDWVITKIYGGGATGQETNDSNEWYGFRYTNENKGWYLDEQFTSYDGRIALATAVNELEKYTYTPTTGHSDGMYDVTIPRDIDGFQHEMMSAGDPHAWEYYSEVMNEYLGMKATIQSFVTIEPDEGDAFKYGTKIEVETVALPKLKIAEAFGGNVWKESVKDKQILEKDVDGIFDPDKEEGYQGVKVDLYECKINYKEPQTGEPITKEDVEEGKYITSTFTDQNGDYRFYGKIAENTPLINPLRKYFVKFVYNGQIYAQTLYNAETNSRYKDFKEYRDDTSKAIDEKRDQFNKRFENIYADSNNYTYTGQRYTGCNGTLTQNYTYTGRAYGLKQVIQEALNNPNYPEDRDTFEEQYNLFIKNNTHGNYITTKAYYEFKNAGGVRGVQIENPVDKNTGEIVSSDIDKDWEYPAKLPNEEVAPHPVDYDYSGLAPSVASYLRDCMIEASVPYENYTHDLTVYGKNMGKTDIKKFPEQSTFNLNDMDRTYLDRYTKYKFVEKAVRDTNPDAVYEDKVPERIKKYINAMNPPPTLGTVITIYEDEGYEYIHIEYGHSGETKDIKVASLTDNFTINFEDEDVTKVAGDTHDPKPRTPGPDDPGPGPDNPPPHYYDYSWFEWEIQAYQEIHDIDTDYVPPRQRYINLYNKEFDLRHCWSFGVYQRAFNEVDLQKDLYKATLAVNGKKEVYTYGKKLKNNTDGDTKYNIQQEPLMVTINQPLNGGEAYTREVRKSDYLFDEAVAYGDGQYSKNIKAYLTYKIQIQNKGPYTVKINEIVDYYDADNLEFDGVRDSNGNLIMDGAEERYQIATHTERDVETDQTTSSKYTYTTNIADTAGHNKEYIGIYNKSIYANGGNNNETFTIANKDSDNDGEPYHLNTLYIRGIDENGNSVGVPSVGQDDDGNDVVLNKLIPGEISTIFITFKVKNNSIDHGITTFANQIKLDQISRDFANTLPTVGKNNFAEINSYATYYTSEIPDDAPIPEKKTYRPYGEGRIVYGDGMVLYKDKDGKDATNINPNPEYNPDLCIAGVVDVYSNPGSFTDEDVEVVLVENEKGDYKEMRFKDYSYRKITRSYPKLNRDDPAEEYLLPFEPDTDKAPTIRIILDNDEIRKISGYVFEDARNVNSDGSPIGNGEFKTSDGDKPINGVTVQLVELIQDVDYDGTFTGQYIGEKVWDECEYTGYTNAVNQLKVYDENEESNQGDNYWSGKGTKYILNSTDTLPMIYTNPEVANESKEDGKYCFAGIPTGDFIIRFLYGDTTRTVLTNGAQNNDSETATDKLGIKETAKVNELVGAVGFNEKSYNGQDYKSTVYQRKLNSNASTAYEVDQTGISYNMKNNNAVKGYTNPEDQDYASLDNYNGSLLRTKDELYRSDVIYYAGEPINNHGNLVASQNALGISARNDIANSYASMWRYDRIATNSKLDLSDANDLYGYRQRGIDYAQGYTTGKSEDEKTLLNYRAEVLSSFERVTSQEKAEETTNGTIYTPKADVQKAMVNELIENTYMVAQSGIISMNNEYEGIDDQDKTIGDGNLDNSTSLHRVSDTAEYKGTHENHAKKIDLGLVERPRSQVKLTKELSNLEIKLADGQTLFNANTSTKDLTYTQHKESEENYNNKGTILEKIRVALKSLTGPELVSANIDDEIMNGATINATYRLKVENIGEIDYQDKYFYYYGKKLATTTEPVRTRVVRVIDYVANDISYDASKQNEDAHWDVYKASELINSRIKDNGRDNNEIDDAEYTEEYNDDRSNWNDGTFENGVWKNGPNTKKIKARTATGNFYDKVNRDYVTRTYAHEVGTYNTIVVTKDMNDRLLPTLYVNTHSSAAGQNTDETTLILTTSITASGNSEDLTYNNLAEIIETSNPYGRRMQVSISGNQEMANQDINDGGHEESGTELQVHHEYSASKIVQPREIDADSAQQLQIMPPTGSPEYRNKILTIITTAIAVIIVLVGAIIIKKKVYDK